MWLEAVWGADPVALYGGIRHIEHNETTRYRSPLTRNATVQWSQRSFNISTSDSGSEADVFVDHPDVDWQFAQKIYGWSAFQYQSWVKGGILNAKSTNETVVLYPDNILELWIDDYHVFGGDFFGFGRSPIVVDLRPGINQVSVRLVREVRSMGGIFPPEIRAKLRVGKVVDPLAVVTDGILMPDVVDGRLCSRYGSVTLRNQDWAWITIHNISTNLDGRSYVVMEKQVRLAPGQSRPLKMEFDIPNSLADAMAFSLIYSLEGGAPHELEFETGLRLTEISALQKVTFLHTSGVVSYATLRPPPLASAQIAQRVPVLMNLHGAGVEADGPLARHMFDDAQDLPAWILSPTGMSPWSGDDWHTWGFADAQAAVSAIADWIKRMDWEGPGLLTEKLLIAGHSNGGQGAWFFASHQPDRVLGAAVASGYSSIENYVPFALWNEADALQSGIIQASRSSFRHELLVENLVGLPLLQQHGSADDNVPTYHSRLMNTLLAQAGELANYSEMLDKGHWFDGSMTTQNMMDFYRHHLSPSSFNDEAPSSFSFIVPNSHDMGSKFGIFVDQLTSPDRLGRVKVTIGVQDSVTQWHLSTENVHRFHLDHPKKFKNGPAEICLDDLGHCFEIKREAYTDTFVKSASLIWGREVALDWKSLDQRYGRQRGALDSILRSTDTFELVLASERTMHFVVQTSRNLLQYFGADTNILPFAKYERALESKGNVITFCLGHFIPKAQLPTFPIRLDKNQLLLTTKESRVVPISLSAGMGGVWLRPLLDERLELVAWGYDEAGLRQAARLIPTLTGAGQPDFVILGAQASWKGYAGALAMGFFDHNWEISHASYLP